MFDRPPQPDGTTAPAFGQFGNLDLLVEDPAPPVTTDPQQPQPAPTN